jgi:8-oxo-dGTP pyrophosphatase MutT (NUDIX family)
VNAVHDAATVALLRDGGDGVQTWLLTRKVSLVFAAGRSVFPGGRVEDEDADLPYAAPPPGPWPPRIYGAAVRETFEETGLLLSVPAAYRPEARADVEAGRLSFGALLRRHRLAVDVSALRPWDRWITPPGEPRRYDTRFFVAAIPDGVDVAHVSGEASAAGWVSVRQALAEGERGARQLLPPTLATLTVLASYPRVADVLAAAGERTLSPIEPRIRVLDGVRYVELPNGATVRMP